MQFIAHTISDLLPKNKPENTQKQSNAHPAHIHAWKHKNHKITAKITQFQNCHTGQLSLYDSFRSLSSFELVDKFNVSCDDAANFASAACRAAAAAAKRPALDRSSRFRSGMPITSKSSPDRGRLPLVVRRPLVAFLSASSGLLLLLLASIFCLSISWSWSLTLLFSSSSPAWAPP